MIGDLLLQAFIAVFGYTPLAGDVIAELCSIYAAPTA